MDMAQGDEFYLTLPSNASLDVYPENKIWNYRVKLAKPIILNQPYQVAVIEVQYPKNWPSFPPSDATAALRLTDKSGITTVVSFDIPVGYYDNIPKIVKEINSHIVRHTKKMTMLYNGITNRVFFTGEDSGGIKFKGRLAQILGFKPNVYFPIRPDTAAITAGVAPHPADIYGGCYSMFIYTDIIEYQRVGDTHVPLLRSINVADDPRRVPTLVYDKPHYTSISKAVIGDIEISIKNDQNQDIRFTYGKVIIKLHFRPIRNNF